MVNVPDVRACTRKRCVVFRGGSTRTWSAPSGNVSLVLSKCTRTRTFCPVLLRNESGMRAVREVSVIVRPVVEIERRNPCAAASIVASSWPAIFGSRADDDAIRIACAPSFTRRSSFPTNERKEASDSFAAASCRAVTVGGFG